MQEREIVVFRYRKGLRIGTHLETAQSKARVATEKDRAFTVPSENLIYGTECKAEDQGALKAFIRKVEALAAEIDLGELWELLRDEAGAFEFTDLAELYWDGRLSADRYAAFIWHLNTGDCPYFETSGERYCPAAEEVVIEHRERLRRQAEESSEEGSFLGWLSGESDELSPEAMSPRQRAWLERLLDYVVSGEDAPQSARAKSFLMRLRKGGDLRRFAFDQLVGRGVLAADENLDLRRSGVPVEFPEEANAAAAAYDAQSAIRVHERRDLREREVFSIDGESTMDVDDAFSLRATDSGYELGIHITDLSAAVEDGDALDRVARQRLVSFYFPEVRISMLPESLSCGSGSLLEGEERPVLSLLARFDRDLRLTGTELVPARLINRHQLSYDEADSLLAGASHPVAERLETVERIARAHRRRRIEAGAVEFDRPEALVQIDDTGEVQVECGSRETPANHLVSEMMILYNVEVAKYAAARDLPFVYRTQAAAGPLAEVGATSTAYDRYRFFKAVAPSHFSLERDPHHLLGVDLYSQVSSPLRRYIDLIAQRQLIHALRTGAPAYSEEALSRVVYEAEERLRELGRLEFARQRYWLLKYLSKRRGEAFDGCVLEARERDCLVELESYGLRGSAVVSRDVKPGDQVAVEVVQVDPWDQHLKFRIV